MDQQLEAQIEELASLIRSRRYLVAFSGAGISTESGIPDFRGPQGIWKKMRPTEMSEFLVDPATRLEYWRRKIESYPQMWDTEPIVGRLQTVITQNIDSV